MVEKVNRCARTITKAIRFLISKKFVKRVEIIKRERSVLVVQAYVRQFLAKKKVKELLKLKQRMWKANEAAIIIQRNLAERHRATPTLRLARATMASLRSFRKLVDFVMSGFLENYLEDMFNDLVEDHIQELLYLRDQVVEQVEEHCLDLLFDDWVALALEQHIQLEIQRIEEENRRVAEEQAQMLESLRMMEAEEETRRYLKAMEEIRQALLEAERKRKAEIEAMREEVALETIREVLEHAISQEVNKQVETMKQELFTRTVIDFVQQITDGGLENASSTLIAQYLLDLARETSMVISQVAERLAEDSLSVALSTFSEARQSFLVNELNSIMGGEVEDELTVDADERKEEDLASLEDEVRSVILEVDDEGEGDTVRMAVGKPAVELAKDVRGTAQYFAQGRYDLALQDLDPAVNLLQSRITLALEQQAPEDLLVRMGVVLSVMLLLKAKCQLALARYPEAKSLLDDVQEIRSEAFNNDHYLVGEQLLVRAEWCRGQAQYSEADELLNKAEAILTKEIKVYEQMLAEPEGGDNVAVNCSVTIFKIHHRILIARADLMRNIGQYYKAHNLLMRIETSLQRFKQRAGISSFEVEEDFVTSLMALCRLSGQRQIVRSWHTKLLEQRHGRYRDHHPKIASSLCILGELALEEGQGNEALNLVDQGLRMRYEFYPLHHPAIAAGHLLKSRVLCAQGKSHEAFLEALRGLRIFQDIFTSEHPALAAAFSQLGWIQLGLGEPMLAHASAEQALTIFNKHFQIEVHAKANEARLLQALALLMSGNPVEAMASFRSVIHLEERLLVILRATSNNGSLRLTTARLLLIHCQAIAGQQNPKKELPLAIEAISKSMETQERHPLAVLGLAFMGQLARLRGNYLDAQKLLQSVFQTLQALYPQGHPFLLFVQIEYVRTLSMAGYLVEAEDVIDGAIATAARLFAQSPSNTLMGNLLLCQAEVLRDLERYEEAEVIYVRAINIFRQKAGAESGGLACALASMARHYHMRQRWSLSERYYLQCLRSLQLRYGSRSLTFEIALLQYAELLMDGRQWSAALALLKDEVLPALLTLVSPRHPIILLIEADLDILHLVLDGGDDVSIVSETLASLPKVQAFLTFWNTASFSSSHPWIVRMQKLPIWLSTVASSSLASSLVSSSVASTSVASSRTSNTSYYGSVNNKNTNYSPQRSALSVISEREESLATSSSLQSLSRSQTEASGQASSWLEDDPSSQSMETGSQASSSYYSVSTSYYDYNASQASSYLSPRSLSYTTYSSYESSNTPRSSYQDGSSLGGVDESPRSILTPQSSVGRSLYSQSQLTYESAESRTYQSAESRTYQSGESRTYQSGESRTYQSGESRTVLSDSPSRLLESLIYGTDASSTSRSQSPSLSQSASHSMAPSQSLSPSAASQQSNSESRSYPFSYSQSLQTSVTPSSVLKGNLINVEESSLGSWTPSQSLTYADSSHFTQSHYSTEESSLERLSELESRSQTAASYEEDSLVSNDRERELKEDE
eukprot:scaffold3057_cov163-Ochromonas_danica.AAC.1